MQYPYDLMAKITEINAREILDSRGNPTVEVDVIADNEVLGRASVPSGASTGTREALELRDGDMERYLGKGVLKAVENVQTIIEPRLIGEDISDQSKIDRIMIELDETDTKSNLGANAILGVSLAVLKVAALVSKQPLYQYIHDQYNEDGAYCMPVPMVNIINGGVHADHSADIQEYMIMPIGAKSLRHAVQMASEVFHHLKKILADRGFQTTVGDEGGFAPSLANNEEPFQLMISAIVSAGYEPGKDIMLALDSAADQFYKNDRYEFARDGTSLTSAELIAVYADWIQKYPIYSLEDGLNEHDEANWILMNKQLGDTIQLVGDDLIVTNPTILEQAIAGKWANAVLVKLNQIGTVSETIHTVTMAQKAGWNVIISHRSGETEDTTIADLAVGLGIGQIKTGSMSRSERIGKYNQLMRIEEALGAKAVLYQCAK